VCRKTWATVGGEVHLWACEGEWLGDKAEKENNCFGLIPTQGEDERTERGSVAGFWLIITGC